MAVSIFIWVTTLSALIYLVLMVIITIGWYRVKRFEGQRTSSSITISIVIAVRNEEENINRLLECLYDQDFPKEDFEIIIIDDHSDDLTKKIIGAYRKKNKIDNIVLAKPKKPGKKASIAYGVTLAIGKLVVTTDGDCEMDPQWLSRICSYYQQYDPKLIVAPVTYQNEKGIFQKMFSLDFMSLVASGAGSIGVGYPLMGNSANLAFDRQAYKKIIADLPGDQFSSGDDVFLIQKMSEVFGKESIHFLKDHHVIVRTAAPANLRSFFGQRIRWASKAKGYRSFWSLAVPLAVTFFNLMLALVFIAGFFKSWFFVLFGVYVLLKFLIDYPLLSDFMRFSNKQNLKWFVFPLELIYPFYIVTAAFASLFFSYEWKGRKGLR